MNFDGEFALPVMLGKKREVCLLYQVASKNRTGSPEACSKIADMMMGRSDFFGMGSFKNVDT